MSDYRLRPITSGDVTPCLNGEGIQGMRRAAGERHPHQGATVVRRGSVDGQRKNVCPHQIWVTTPVYDDPAAPIASRENHGNFLRSPPDPPRVSRSRGVCPQQVNPAPLIV